MGPTGMGGNLALSEVVTIFQCGPELTSLTTEIAVGWESAWTRLWVSARLRQGSLQQAVQRLREPIG